MRQYSGSTLFRQRTRQAAKAEQQGDYDIAVQLWTLARQVARNPANQHWCECRAIFCSTRQ